MMKGKRIVLNVKKMNFDGNLDFSILSSDVTVYWYNWRWIMTYSRCRYYRHKRYNPTISILKLVKAGTSYNNIDLEAYQKKGIVVCNIPAYSTERVANTPKNKKSCKILNWILQLSSHIIIIENVYAALRKETDLYGKYFTSVWFEKL